ncbi:gamma-glutamyltransferase [Sphingomonas naphthae]|uniref:Glutathione hydrolase proenzyme n=2 Tax=Sphingomonas naphthae TaxID=1813468 RepID=A0ABY7TRQ2_9SPHN|nr:gamma-glutamyltransferase [Sphingomonas naphthae]WCT75371.1 gamma-glutamyltransferase [Sphingomonas naphthae]
MTSAADPRAAAAGAEILRAGGSATDAAIAMMLALNVVEPHNSGIGGGGFLLHSDGATGKLDTYNGREKAPAAADIRWFYGADGKPLSIRDAIPGGRSVGVPGNLAMMALAHKAHGRLPWARLFQPAIRLATDGFAITPRMFGMMSNYSSHVDAWGKSYLLGADGKPKPVGTILKNPDQAAFFARIAKKGPAEFYRGKTAAKLVATVNDSPRNPSKMTVRDLSAYTAQQFAPVCGTYRAYKVCGMGPPSSGGVAVLQILKQLERFDMAALGKDSPTAWHLFAESSRLAYADRNAYLGDPDKVSVPVAGLTDPAYLAARSALIAPDRSMATIAAGAPPGAPPKQPVPPRDEQGTSHMVAVDRQGDVVTITSTIESIFGSGLTLNGIFLNNELTDFDIVPEADGYLVANRVEGGKRPRSSMAPTIVYGPDGRIRIALGAAGGSTIIAQIAKALVGVLDWNLSAQDAIALPLLYAPGATGVVEKGTALEAMVPALNALGEKLAVAPLGLKANAVEWKDGHWQGAADPRSEGEAYNEDGTKASNITRVGKPPQVRD